MSETHVLSDAEFAQAFLDGSLPNEQFHHRDHLRLVWFLIRREGNGAGDGDDGGGHPAVCNAARAGASGAA